MHQLINKLSKSKHIKHETKRNVLLRFLLVLGVIAAYLIFSIYQFGINNGVAVTVLSWSFFVFCTPIADAGFILDFPIRLITKIRMIHSEMVVWTIATIVNIVGILFFTGAYEKTVLLVLFKKILVTPFPFWSIIVLSAIGTFISIHFGDELLDTVKHSERKSFHKHKNKHKLILIATIIVITITIYYLLLSELGIII